MLSLKTILLINGISSGITGIALILFSQPVANLFGLDSTIAFTGTGIFLVLFASYVLLTATQKELKAAHIKTITGLDILWVVLSIMVTIGSWATISLVGSLLILGVAGWVGLMAYLQSGKPAI
ncbi:hypothetical protein [Flavihumibacter sp. UBA7668]|uniref:hypothetical protein n=1 Tax=Flavihumibacter sp. UBA7668 TaxID=1946542 RepID=UPI0025BBA00C|nr:hypothetical protein [Flavihumibacter sp. UBA7668]